jgi:hypothetical protein
MLLHPPRDVPHALLHRAGPADDRRMREYLHPVVRLPRLALPNQRHATRPELQVSAVLGSDPAEVGVHPWNGKARGRRQRDAPRRHWLHEDQTNVAPHESRMGAGSGGPPAGHGASGRRREDPNPQLARRAGKDARPRHHSTRGRAIRTARRTVQRGRQLSVVTGVGVVTFHRDTRGTTNGNDRSLSGMPCLP